MVCSAQLWRVPSHVHNLKSRQHRFDDFGTLFKTILLTYLDDMLFDVHVIPNPNNMRWYREQSRHFLLTLYSVYCLTTQNRQWNMYAITLIVFICSMNRNEIPKRTPFRTHLYVYYYVVFRWQIERPTRIFPVVPTISTFWHSVG